MQFTFETFSITKPNFVKQFVKRKLIRKPSQKTAIHLKNALLIMHYLLLWHTEKKILLNIPKKIFCYSNYTSLNLCLDDFNKLFLYQQITSEYFNYIYLNVPDNIFSWAKEILPFSTKFFFQCMYFFFCFFDSRTLGKLQLMRARANVYGFTR